MAYIKFNKYLLIVLLLQMLCFILFFSTALAKLPEFIADILWMVVTMIGYIFGFGSLLKESKKELPIITILLSLVMTTFFVFALLLSGM
ncbi:hypothetical protein [Bacillus paranthracis]|uniref:hypothetical protein n=1 Tax=Bacillus paranthracis TaxID=2026186 RepID=UPI003D6508E7